jgi:ADP-ribose pyrophosphatase YjhB (NUDIX family)
MNRLIKKANKMEVIYAQEKWPVELKNIKKSIFLAGPTPRDDSVKSWRDEALAELKKIGYDGVVYIPEAGDESYYNDYTEQIDWEHACLDACDVIVFWIPRDMDINKNTNEPKMAALTTNVEFGLYCKSGKLAIGSPKDAPHCTYLQAVCKDEQVEYHSTLKDTLQYAVDMIGDGAVRSAGECTVPLLIWNNEQFQNWYSAQKAVGNELRDLKVNYIFLMPKARILFLWICDVKVYIKAEDRIKDNEFVLSRSDMSSVVMYNKQEDIMDSSIVLVKEFRSPCDNKECFVHEIPGGSSNSKKAPGVVAANEVEEETGIKIKADRIKPVASRQASATLSAHRIHCYSVELTDEELKTIKSKENSIHGIVEDTERTYLEVKTLKEIMGNELLDWNNIGMILSCLMK